MKYPKVVVNRKGVEKVLKRYLWLTLDEVKSAKSQLEQIPKGSLVSLYSEEGYFLAQGYFNPKVKYCIKVLCREDVPIDKEFFAKAFKRALNLRRELYPGEVAFRLIFSEGDFLPGLIVDVFDKVAVVQVYTLGMEKLLSHIISALREVLEPSSVVLKNDAQKRKEEGLSLYTEVAWGCVDEPLLVEMDGIKFLIPVLSGQKTGFFLDQRDARRYLAKLSQGKEALDLYSYVGGFSFYALKGGAKRVILVDRSQAALDLAEEIAKLNGFSEKVVLIKEDVLNYLKNPSFLADVVIVDPPAFIKSKGDLDQGLKLYDTLYFSCLRLFAERCGFLALFSCSHFLAEETQEEIIKRSLAKLGFRGRIIKKLNQAQDHPINPMVKETHYLKGRVLYLENS
jgi:23S rRNA (cytosine1962-C5)-methyltransferase